MKKILLILALAFGVLPMAAESATVSGSSTTGMSETIHEICPINFNYNTFVAQTLYPASAFAKLYEVGEKTFTLNSLTISCQINDNAYSNYGDELSDVKIYVENVSDVVFQQDQSGKYKWHVVSDEAVVGHAIPVSNYDLMGYAYDTYEFEFTFDTQFEYSGESVLITWVSNVPTVFDANAFDAFTGFETDYTASIYRESDTQYTDEDGIFAVGIAKNSQKMLPVIDIDYNVVKIENAPTIVEGTPSTLKVGTYDADDEYGSLTQESVPVNTMYTNFGSQLIYTATELAELPQVDAEGNKVTPKITALTFKLPAKTDVIFSTDYDIHGTVYIENTSLTSIPKTNGTYSWIDFSKDNSATFAIDLSDECWETPLWWSEDDVVEFTIDLGDNAIEYTGESLLVTFDGCNDFDGEAFIKGIIGFKTSDTQMGYFADDRAAFSEGLTSVAPLTNTILPVLKLHYTPLIEKGGEAKNVVSFGNVEPLLMTANVDPALASSSLTGINDIKKLSAANYIALAYTIDDANASADKSYEIQLDNKSLGTVTGTSGVIKYINPVPVGDLYLKVVPSDAQSVGKATTVEKATVENLLPQPEVSVVKSQYYITAHDTDPLKANIHAAVKFHFATAEGAVASVSVSSDSSNPQRKLLHDGSANSSVEFDSEFLSLDAENWNQLHLNNNSVSFYYPSVLTAEYVDGQLVVPSRGFSSGIKASVSYPTVSLAQPTLTEGTQAELFAMNYDIDASNAQQFTYKAVSKSPADESYNGVKFTIEPPRSEDLSGVESVVVDAYGEVEYFNLQGVRVAEPTAGMYIRRQGNTVAKVLVK